MSRRTAELHADWLRLVEPERQFLSLAVLRRAFPNGLNVIPAEIREQLRDRYPAGVERSEAQWNAWLDWLLRDVLAWGACYRTGEDAAAYLQVVPEQGIVLKADGVLCDPQTGEPRVLVTRCPYGTALDKRLPGDRWNTSPIDRLVLLCRARGIRIGLATDGERIVLVWVPTAGTGGHATWDTALFTESRERNLLQSFASLLHASRFFAVRADAQLEALFEASEKAQDEVTGQLGLQVRQAVELLVAALSRADLERGGKLLAGVPPQTVYEAAVTVMMRLVFLLYAEEHDLLPLGEPLYAEHYAVSTLREQLDEQAAMEGDEPLERRGAAWYRLLALFRIVYHGISHDRLRVPPYGGRLFDPDRFAFLEGQMRPLPVDDLTVRAILEAIQTLPIRESGSRERRRLSFRSLDVEQIGHVYEGLLDHGAVRVDDVYVGLVGKAGDEAEMPLADLERAACQGRQPLVSFLHDFTGKSENAIARLIERGQAVAQGRDGEARRLVNTVCDNNAALAGRVSPFVYALRTDLHGLPVVFPPESLVVKQTRARRDSGTEYTPRELAEEMVRYTLEPLVYSPGPKEGFEPEQWRLLASTELLDLKICDPAVGSGAFLVSACRYLADRVVEAWIVEDPECEKVNSQDLTLEARRAVVDRCLYGVDRDPMAVEMAKLSLWLITMARERPFSFLDHSVRAGDSLLGITSLDQLRFLHIEPEAGRAVHKRTQLDATAFVQPMVDRATELRIRLESLPSTTVRDSEQKRYLNDEANRLLENVGLIADGVVSTAIFTANLKEQKQHSAFQGLASLVASAFDDAQSEEQRSDAVDRMRSRNERMLNAGRPEKAPPRTTLHWPLAFPEVFGSARGGFNAIVGNPPFIGGQKITGTFGDDYRAYLLGHVGEGRRGSADLVAYFFLRAAALAKTFTFLAVNTIAQGATREVGLDCLLSKNWRIVRASKSRPWPGKASVHIAQVWLARNASAQTPVLDDTPVREITALLSSASRAHGTPFPLAANTGLAFIGSYVLGMGFTMSPETATALIEKDERNRQVLFPFLNAEDLGSRPDGSPSRWIINFFDWPLSRAEEYPDCLDIVRRLVKPERDKNRRARRRTHWWQYGEVTPGLFRALRARSRVIIMPQVSRMILPSMYPTGIVFSHSLSVIADDSPTMFGILSSQIHRLWARKFGSTHLTITNYNVTDCFETFPFPPENDTISGAISKLSEFRSDVMRERALGLTALSRRVNRKDIVDDDICVLRRLYRELDQAVCLAYEWGDLDLDHGFHDTDEGVRWAIGEAAGRESLDRLLELNHERHREEVDQLKFDSSEGNGKHKRRAKAPSANGDQISLIGEHGTESSFHF